MEEGGAAADEEIVWLVDDSGADSGEGGTVAEHALDEAAGDATVVAYHASEPTNIPEAKPSSSDTSQFQAESVAETEGEEQIPEDVVWLVDDPVPGDAGTGTTNAQKEAERKAVADASVRTNEDEEVAKNIENKEGQHYFREVPVENGISSTAPQEDGVESDQS
uniref:Uncharacterized protein n=1 Tax=Steinernema glaseri TaxID=37863 RepID=A0A1I7Y7E5_9BILA